MSKNAELEFNICKMLPEHINEVLRLATESNLSFWSEEDYRLEIERSDAICLVAESGDKEFLGFLVARLIKNNSYAELNNIAVKNKYRGKKVGETLLNHLIKTSSSNRLEKILLEVRESNKPAIGFYSKLNFKTLTVRKDFYQNPAEHALTMVRSL